MNRKYLAILLAAFITTTSVAQQEKGLGLDFDEASYTAVPQKLQLTSGSYRGMPPRASLEAHAPTAGDQGKTGTCTAWATAYHMRTIMWGKQFGITDKARLNQQAFSAIYLYNLIKDSTDKDCQTGTNPILAFEALVKVGVPTSKTAPFLCKASFTPAANTEAPGYKISDYQILFLPKETNADFKTDAVKKAISEGYPVVIAFKVLKSFYQSKKMWQRQPTDADPTGPHAMHAMCVVAYDEAISGGAFKVLNSWGTSWGENGYVWIPYKDLAECTIGALQAYYDRTQPPPPAPTPTPSPNPKPAPIPVPVTMLQGQVQFTINDGTQMPASRVSTRNLVVADDDGGEDLVAYRMDKSYPSGTRFRFFITTNTEAYIYAFATDLTGKVNKIMPYAANISPHIGPNSTVAFPGESKVVKMDDNKGTDYLLILYSTQKLDADAIEKQMTATQGGLSKKIRAALGNKLVDKKQVTYTPGKVGFTLGNFNQNGVVPVMVEISHD